jgi:hypothetical protein
MKMQSKVDQHDASIDHQRQPEEREKEDEEK